MDLKTARRKKRLSQATLATWIGTTQSVISNAERGVYFPNTLTRERVHSIIGPVDWVASRVGGLEKLSGSEMLLMDIADYCDASTQTDREARKEYLIQYINKL